MLGQLTAMRHRSNQIQLNCLLHDKFESEILRALFAQRYDSDCGKYSYGRRNVGIMPKGTRIGRYCSFAPSSVIFNGTHGLTFLALHPYLYNPGLGMAEKEAIAPNRCTVEDDVWVGHGAIILPAVAHIGRGAVIAAGSVFTRNVPRYAIVAGNPATIKKYRFPERIIQGIERTQWWLLDRAQLSELVRKNPSLVYTPHSFFDQMGSSVSGPHLHGDIK